MLVLVLLLLLLVLLLHRELLDRMEEALESYRRDALLEEAEVAQRTLDAEAARGEGSRAARGAGGCQGCLGLCLAPPELPGASLCFQGRRQRRGPFMVLSLDGFRSLALTDEAALAHALL